MRVAERERRRVKLFSRAQASDASAASRSCPTARRIWSTASRGTGRGGGRGSPPTYPTRSSAAFSPGTPWVDVIARARGTSRACNVLASSNRRSCTSEYSRVHRSGTTQASASTPPPPRHTGSGRRWAPNPPGGRLGPPRRPHRPLLHPTAGLRRSIHARRGRPRWSSSSARRWCIDPEIQFALMKWGGIWKEHALQLHLVVTWMLTAPSSRPAPTYPGTDNPVNAGQPRRQGP